MKKMLSIVIGPSLFLIIVFCPLSFTKPEAKYLLGIFLWVISWWLTEVFPLHITGLLGVCLSIFLQVHSAQDAFSHFANPLIFLFMGSFLFSKAFKKYGLDESFGQIILSNTWLRVSPRRIFSALILLTAFLSSWMSNSATTVLMISLVIGLCEQILPHHKKAQSCILLGVAYAASIGGLMTPVGSPPNLIAMGFLESIGKVKINFLEWMIYAIPVCMAALGFLLFIILRELPEQFEINFKHQSLKRVSFTQDQKKLLALMFLLVIFWVGPSILDMIFHTKLTVLFNEGVVAIFLALMLFLLPKRNGEPLLNWQEGSQIDWGTLLLFGSGLSLGSAIFKTNLANDIALFIHIPQDQYWLWLCFIFLIIYFAIFFSEIASNTAAANILIPIILSLSTTEMMLYNSLAVCFGLSLAFMLPVGTPPNAIVYGTGLVPSKQMLSFGLKMNIFCGLAIFLYILLLRYFKTM
jgi:solute carrier family 13 (sodium-dependent dicarboxylate transporter), member 2/3/5